MSTQEITLDYKLSVSGKSYQQNTTGGVISIVVEEHDDMIGMLIVRFSDSEDWK